MNNEEQSGPQPETNPYLAANPELCVRYEPPVIGVVYKRKDSDTKKRIYTILLQKVVFNPDAEEAARQLYLEHPHVLNEKSIPLQQVVQLIRKIQAVLGAEQDEDYEDFGQGQPRKQLFMDQYPDDEFDYEEEEHAQLNHSR